MSKPLSPSHCKRSGLHESTSSLKSPLCCFKIYYILPYWTEKALCNEWERIVWEMKRECRTGLSGGWGRYSGTLHALASSVHDGIGHLGNVFFENQAQMAAWPIIGRGHEMDPVGMKSQLVTLLK